MIGAAVDHTDDVIHDRAQLPELPGGDHHLTACGDHVLDDGHPLADDVGTLGELSCAIGLGLLADEGRGQAGLKRQGGRDRHAAELQSGEHFGAGRQQRHERLGDVREQYRVRLEAVLVEVLGCDLPGAEREGSGQAGNRVDPLRQFVKRHGCHLVEFDALASRPPARRWRHVLRPRRTRDRSTDRDRPRSCDS